ncbi:MAG: 3-methyl-2-oxobutanoate hydroxymethyltransferase, partial [Brachybacterium tyrofermentans]
LGHSSTTATTHQDMLTFTGAVARSVHRPLIVADLAFGTYETGPADAVRHGVELIRAGAEMVKLEGGRAIVPQIRALVEAGIPVMGHLGFTPQSVNALSGHRVQGRDAAGADQLAEDALAIQEAGASAIVLELVPAQVAARITEVVTVPTIGIGAGPSCDGQVLVWQDMAGLSGFHGKFVKAFADLRRDLTHAAEQYRVEVAERSYPGPEHSFD